MPSNDNFTKETEELLKLIKKIEEDWLNMMTPDRPKPLPKPIEKPAPQPVEKLAPKELPKELPRDSPKEAPKQSKSSNSGFFCIFGKKKQRKVEPTKDEPKKEERIVEEPQKEETKLEEPKVKELKVQEAKEEQLPMEVEALLLKLERGIERAESAKKYSNSFLYRGGLGTDVKSHLDCPRCKAKSWIYKSITEGCRMNGDAYGYEYTYCGECGLGDKKLWDDSIVPYFG